MRIVFRFRLGIPSAILCVSGPYLKQVHGRYIHGSVPNGNVDEIFVGLDCVYVT